MSDPEWFHICQKKKHEKDESLRDVGTPSVNPDVSPFTVHPDVPIVIAGPREDDPGEEEE